MADGGTTTKLTWRSAFLAKVKSVVGPKPSKNTETGYRELFVEVPLDRSPEPVARATYESPELRVERARRAFLRATRRLVNSQYGDHVDSLTASLGQFRNGLLRVVETLPSRRVAEAGEVWGYLDRIVQNLAELIEWRMEQVVLVRRRIREHCSTRLAATILRDDDAMAKPGDDDLVSSRCRGDEHVYQVGEPRCDCGSVVVRAAQAAP